MKQQTERGLLKGGSATPEERGDLELTVSVRMGCGTKGLFFANSEPKMWQRALGTSTEKKMLLLGVVSSLHPHERLTVYIYWQ